MIDTALLRSPSRPTADLGLDLRCPRMELAHVTHHHEDKHGSSWVSSARTPSSAPRSGAHLGVLGCPREPDAGPIPAPVTADPSQRRGSEATAITHRENNSAICCTAPLGSGQRWPALAGLTQPPQSHRAQHIPSQRRASSSTAKGRQPHSCPDGQPQLDGLWFAQKAQDSRMRRQSRTENVLEPI